MEENYDFLDEQWEQNPEDILYLTWCSAMKMVDRSGYNVPSTLSNLIWEPDLQDYNTMYFEMRKRFHLYFTKGQDIPLERDYLAQYFPKKTNESKYIYVTFIKGSKNDFTDKNDTHKVLEETTMLHAQGVFEKIYIISDKPLSPNAMAELRKIPGYIYYTDSVIMTSPSDHYLCPVYEKLSNEDTLDLYRKTETTPNNYPKIARDDPLTRENNWKVGDMIKFESFDSFSFSAERKEIYYRTVSKNSYSKDKKSGNTVSSMVEIEEINFDLDFDFNL